MKYKKGQNIRLFSCGNAVLAKSLSKIIPDVLITGPTSEIHVPRFGRKMRMEGYWNTYQNGELIGSYRWVNNKL